MRVWILIIVAFFISIAGYSQVLKNLGKELESDARWKVRMKVNHKMDQALDTLVAQPKKIIQAKKDSSAQKTPKKDQGQENNGMTASVSPDTGDDTQGYITLDLSAYEVFSNGTVTISGNSLKFGNLTEVKLKISGPSTDQTLPVPLNESNGYSKDFNPAAPGDYVITALSSNDKAKQTATLKVHEIGLMNWEKNIQVTDKALDRLKEEVKRAGQSISSKDKAQLDKKIDEVEEQAELAKKLFTDLDEAMKQLKGMDVSKELGKNLSDLNNVLSDQRVKMEQMNDLKHEPYDNTICEYLVIVNEACAAFQTFTNFWAKTVQGILKNIIIDKGVPAAVDAVNDNVVKAGTVKSGAAKVFSKYAANAAFDAESLETKIGKAGMAADVVQFICDVLLKTYCGLFSGELTEDYTITYRNKYNQVWWRYSYQTKAAVTFRYPKSQSGKLIKMKGNVEGNATKFTFFQDPEQMDEFEKARGKAKLYPVELLAPTPVPFATSQYDYLGFGAVTRGLVTPAYFNIPVDADYDPDGGTIKLFLNTPLIDFTDRVEYVYGYVAISMGIPIVTVIKYPINKVKRTLNKVVEEHNMLQVTKSAKNSLLVKGDGTTHIGVASSAIEHLISYSLTAKNDN